MQGVSHARSRRSLKTARQTQRFNGFRIPIKHRVPRFILASAVALLLPHAVTAATLVWDANTGVTGAQDGAGTWSLSGLDWWSQGAAAGSNVAITSADIASFGAGGAGGTVTLNANQSVLGLNFG